MDPMREDSIDQILANIDRSRRVDRGNVFSVGPFTLCWDYARPTLGSTVFTASDVRNLLRYANESRRGTRWLRTSSSWSGMSWNGSSSALPRLAPATCPRQVSRFGRTHSSASAPAPLRWTASRAPLGAEIEIVDPDSDPRELLAAWHFADATGPAPLQSPEGVLDGIRRVAASLSEDEVATWRRHHADAGSGQVVVRSQGRIVALGMHEPSAEVSEITSLAVLPPFRRRGFGTALAAALAADAFDRGKDLVYVESAPEAAELYVRAGFQLIGSIGRASL